MTGRMPGYSIHTQISADTVREAQGFKFQLKIQISFQNMLVSGVKLIILT